MSWYEVEHTDKLYGEINVQGSKNAVLPILVASLLAKDVSFIEGCPDISDVHNTISILRNLGCIIKVKKKISGLDIVIDSSVAYGNIVEEEQFGKMRASIIFLGALLAINGSAKIGYPGGCVIGKRPVDMHIKALTDLGAVINEYDTYISGTVERFVGTDIKFAKKSVGATENILMAAVKADGITVIHNCAREPEVIELCRFLRLMGAVISGEGTDVIMVKGVEKLHGCNFVVSGDRIVAATYLSAVCICGGEVTLKNIRADYCKSTISLLKKAGLKVKCNGEGLVATMVGSINGLDCFSTGPYPEIPTDIQPLIMSVMCFSNAITVIKENIFENRFMHCSELVRMGADIAVIEQKAAVIDGKGKLVGTEVYGKDLRGTAALILAGLGAEGKTKVYGTEFIRRGYEDIASDLRRIGGRIRLSDEDEKIDNGGNSCLYNTYCNCNSRL